MNVNLDSVKFPTGRGGGGGGRDVKTLFCGLCFSHDWETTKY